MGPRCVVEFKMTKFNVVLDEYDTSNKNFNQRFRN